METEERKCEGQPRLCSNCRPHRSCLPRGRRFLDCPLWYWLTMDQDFWQDFFNNLQINFVLLRHARDTCGHVNMWTCDQTNWEVKYNQAFLLYNKLIKILGLYWHLFWVCNESTSNYLKLSKFCMPCPTKTDSVSFRERKNLGKLTNLVFTPPVKLCITHSFHLRIS